MLDSELSQPLKVRFPRVESAQQPCIGVREQDMPGIAAVHHALRRVDASAENVEAAIFLRQEKHSSNVQTHPQRQFRLTAKGGSDVRGALYGGNRVSMKDERHPIPRIAPGDLLFGSRTKTILSLANQIVQPFFLNYLPFVRKL